MNTDLLKEIAQHIPFVSMAVMPVAATGKVPMFVTRLMEAAIIGGIIMFGTVKTLEHDLAAMSNTIQEIKADMKEIRRDFYRPRLPAP